MTSIGKPKDAVTLIARGIVFDVWAMRGEQVGLVDRRNGDLAKIAEHLWRKALGGNRTSPANPSLDEARVIDSACKNLTRGDRPALHAAAASRITEHSAS